MIITIHRGSHEIGGTCIELISRGGTRIVLDMGQPLPQLDDTAAVDLAAERPPIKGLYENDGNEKTVDALLISHAHQDHYGLMRGLHPAVPCFMSEPTRQLVEITARFTGNGINIANHRRFHSGEAFCIGDLHITPYLVDHSAFDAHAFLIEDGDKRIFYSGDFRAHGRKAKLFEYFVAQPPAPVDLLLLEGTMLARPGETCDSEQELEQKLVAAVKQTQHLVLSCVSGQNIDRLVTLYRLAKRTSRTLVIDPYVAHILDTLAAKNPSLPHPSADFSRHLKIYYPRHLCRRMRLHLEMGAVLDQFGIWRIHPSEFRRQPDRYILLVRDSMAAELKPELGDTAHGALFLYGLWKGYWNRSRMQNLQDWVEAAEINFCYAHTSGHAVTADLNRLAAALQPEQIVPVHTSQPEDYERYFGPKVRVAMDGAAIRVGNM